MNAGLFILILMVLDIALVGGIGYLIERMRKERT